jgi:hypothetical protein
VPALKRIVEILMLQDIRAILWPTADMSVVLVEAVGAA